jgi:hypothetical protein
VSYPAEIWPFTLRARGLAITYFSAYTSLFLNVFANPIALEKIGWKYYILYIALLILICLTIYFVYPETKGHSLEEMARLFDGDDVLAQGTVLNSIIARKGAGMDVESTHIEGHKPE